MLIITGIPEFIKTIMKMDMTNFNPEDTLTIPMKWKFTK